MDKQVVKIGEEDGFRLSAFDKQNDLQLSSPNNLGRARRSRPPKVRFDNLGIIFCPTPFVVLGDYDFLKMPNT